jgi:8-oxo-dGTP pyrophosphatase MutT (NUDIX family)
MTALLNRYEDAVRDSLLETLRSYRGIDEADTERAKEIAEFVQREAACAERSLRGGHLTGSAWVVNREGDKVLLLHHRKLRKWLQPGGHADGEMNLLAVALREAREESGLVTLAPVSTAIFDVDIHAIPARGDEPEHLHYDLRFAIVADEDERLRINEESNSLLWMPLDRVPELTQEESILRMCRKWRERHSNSAASL